MVDVKEAVIVDGEPFEAIRNARKATQEIARRDIQSAGVNRPGRFQFLKVRQKQCVLRQQVYLTLQPERIHHRHSECRNGSVWKYRSLCGHSTEAQPQSHTACRTGP